MRMIATTRLTVLAAAVAAGGLAVAQAAGNAGEKSWCGTVVTVDPGDKTVIARDWIGLKRTYQIGDRCAVSTLDKEQASPSDLRPGEKVRIGYKEDRGVRVADRIDERRLQEEGTVQAVDVKARTVTVKASTSRTTFHLADHGDVALRSGRAGTLADIKAGDKISLIYELPDHSPVAYHIQEEYLRFTGALNAVDLEARTAKASQLFNEKKFNFANGCEVRVPGKEHGQLSDLKLGRRYEFSYADLDGVNVVDHVTEILSPEEQAQVASTPPAQQ